MRNVGEVNESYVARSCLYQALVYNKLLQVTARKRPDHANLEDIVQFMTGLRQPPPLGFATKITIDFIDDAEKLFVEVSACLFLLHLPTSATSRTEFFKNFDKAVLYSLNHFGQC